LIFFKLSGTFRFEVFCLEYYRQLALINDFQQSLNRSNILKSKRYFESWTSCSRTLSLITIIPSCVIIITYASSFLCSNGYIIIFHYSICRFVAGREYDACAPRRTPADRAAVPLTRSRIADDDRPAAAPDTVMQRRT